MSEQHRWVSNSCEVNLCALCEGPNLICGCPCNCWCHVTTRPVGGPIMTGDFIPTPRSPQEP